MIVKSSRTSFKAHNITRSYAVAGNIYFHGQMRAGIEAALVFRGRRRPAWAMTRLDQVQGFVVIFTFFVKLCEILLTALFLMIMLVVVFRCPTPSWTSCSRTPSRSRS